jgi:hypothetical protein
MMSPDSSRAAPAGTLVMVISWTKKPPGGGVDLRTGLGRPSVSDGLAETGPNLEISQPMKQRVFLVSPPRSGHNMMVEFLDGIFQPLDYCEFYACVAPGARLECEAARWPHEMKLACRSGRMIQKNHDLALRLPLSDEFRYVVTLRHPIYSLTSWHTHWTKTAPPGKVVEPFGEFMLAKAQYWRGFAEKWVDVWSDNLLNIPPNIRITRYEDLVRFPEEIHSIATFINGDVPPAGLEGFTMDHLRRKVHRNRRLSDEPGFDPSLFAAVQERIGLGLMARCGFEEMTFTA